jgi:hypothetical protein
MKSIFVVSGILALAFAGPAISKPGNGQGNGHQSGYGYEGRGVEGPVGYGVGGCPPGLAKKEIGCMPPGQARKLLRGQRVRYGSGTRYGYGRVRHSLRNRVNPRTKAVEHLIDGRRPH